MGSILDHMLLSVGGYFLCFYDTIFLRVHVTAQQGVYAIMFTRFVLVSLDGLG